MFFMDSVISGHHVYKDGYHLPEKNATVQVLFDESITNHLVTADRLQLTANVFVSASVIISQILGFSQNYCYKNFEPYGIFVQ